MAQRGTGSDAGPNACPFVALELDRDRRSERPDHRHRCYAEQVPAPRTVAHQERFCLSPNFPGCPIFQDWAVRAAARPVPLPKGYEGGRRATPDPRTAGAAGVAGLVSSSAPEPEPEPEPEPKPDEGWPDSMTTPPALGGAAAGAPDEPIEEEQLSAFEAPPVDIVASPPRGALPDRAPTGRQRDFDRAIREMNDDPPADALDVDEHDGAAAVPAFLAARSTRPRPSPKMDGRVPRDDVVPSWDIDGRYGALAGGEPRGDGLFGRLLTMAAVVIILALGVAAVVLVPGLLSGSPPQTARPSFSVPPRSPSAAASGLAVVPSPTRQPLTTPSPIGEPTPAATPEPSPRLYRIKSGDTLARVARRFDVIVADILAANPQINDPNDIQGGQLIVIPLPATTPAP